MNEEMIGKDADAEALSRFLFDLRRALRQQRRMRSGLFFFLCFPAEQEITDVVDFSMDALDFRTWLPSVPPEEIASNRLYRDLLAEQGRLLAIAATLIPEAGRLTPPQLAALLRTQLLFEQIADRVAAAITTTMTDLDTLTGLLNRSAMERDLVRVKNAASQSGKDFCLAMIDADLFKRVNDEHGHGFGDLVLATLADRFVASLRPRDQVYRYGGEEFLLILPDTPLEKAIPLLERLRQRAGSAPVEDGEMRVCMTVSIGATVVAAGEENMQEAVDRADAALYKAKQTGRNRLVCDPCVTDI